MENHVRKITTRSLSLYGKAIIINTLILSKTTFLSNVFPILEQTLSKIYTIHFNYLWHNKKPELIARKTLFLPKCKGGLNIKEPEVHNYSMRIKHLLTLRQKEHKPPWMQIATYWLAKEIYNYNKDCYHLKNNNILKTTKAVPFYYRKKNTFLLYSQPQTKDLLYKILHYTTPTNNFIYKISKDTTDLTPNCNYCNKIEDNIHLFKTCDRIRKIWAYFQPYCRQLTKRNYTPQQHLFILTSNNINFKTKKLILILTQIIIYEI